MKDWTGVMSAKCEHLVKLSKCFSAVGLCRLLIAYDVTVTSNPALLRGIVIL